MTIDINLLATIFGLYIFIKIYISFMQIGFISQKMNESPIILSTDNFIRAGQYSIMKERSSILETVVEYSVFLFWIIFGFDFLSKNLSSDIFSQTIFVFAFFTINAITTLPFEFYNKFIIDKKFGFNNSTYRLFLIDKIKAFMIYSIVGTVLIYSLLYFIINVTNWWLFSAIAISMLIILINILYPVFIPFFNKLYPLENSELKDSIENILKSTGFKSGGIFVIDASKRDGRLNAFFGGLGSSKTVVLYDTLIAKLTNSEIVSVIGHELGHFKNSDNYKNIFMITFFINLFFISANFLNLSYKNSGEFLVILSIYFSLALFFVSPILSFVYRKNEFNADKFGAKISGTPLFLSEALKKLITENRSFPISHPIYRFFYETHPTVSERLEHLNFTK